MPKYSVLSRLLTRGQEGSVGFEQLMRLLEAWKPRMAVGDLAAVAHVL